MQAWLFLGTLWPAYSSFKAVRTRNNQEYVRELRVWLPSSVNHHLLLLLIFSWYVILKFNQGRWMAHWVVMAFYTAADSILSPVFSWYHSHYNSHIVINSVWTSIIATIVRVVWTSIKLWRWLPGFNEARFLLLLYLVLPMTRLFFASLNQQRHPHRKILIVRGSLLIYPLSHPLPHRQCQSHKSWYHQRLLASSILSTWSSSSSS